MPSGSGFRYGIAIDAGSSGSRIYLYRWPKPEHASTSTSGSGDGSTSNGQFIKVEERAVFSQERTPGISADHGVGLVLLEELIGSAKAALPADVDPSEVPLHLGATAGMRIIDAVVQADTMRRIRSLLRSSGFLFRDDWARIISGEEEGVYDWLVANYLKNKGNFSIASNQMYGALDLGGASTQISFIPASEQDRTTREVRGRHRKGFPVRLDNREYPLYTQSFLHYGVNQARMRYDDKFASLTKINPCYPTGYTDPESNISGSSNWEGCLQTVAHFFEQSSNCYGEGERCLMGDIHKFHVAADHTFIAMSAFYFTWDYLGLKTGIETDDLVELNATAHHVCSCTQTKQKERYHQKMKDKPPKKATAKQYAQCFNAAYSYHLLSKGYGMPLSKTPIEIHFDINGTKVQWALGLMLIEANGLGWIFRAESLKAGRSLPFSDWWQSKEKKAQTKEGGIVNAHLAFFTYLLSVLLLLFVYLRRNQFIGMRIRRKEPLKRFKLSFDGDSQLNPGDSSKSEETVLSRRKPCTENN